MHQEHATASGGQLKQAPIINVGELQPTYLWRRSSHHSRRPPNSIRLNTTIGMIYLHLGDEHHAMNFSPPCGHLAAHL